MPELAGLDLISRWPRSPVPVEMVFGDADLLSPPVVIERAPALLGPRDTLRVVPGAGHMVHFDAPAVIRSVILGDGPIPRGDLHREAPHQHGPALP